MSQYVEVYSLFTDFDVSLFRSGKHFKLYEKFGSHVIDVNGVEGVYFSVWAPNASSVAVVGNFNAWNPHTHKLFVRWDESGIWEGFIPGLQNGEIYKYQIISNQGEKLEKADPFALKAELPPKTASIVSTTWYEWEDAEWLKEREARVGLNKPIAVYEMHLGSWMRSPDDPEEFLNYRDIAKALVPYILETGFTHVEFLPVMEHPYYPSWGYQITGYFAATSRYGTPQDLMFLIEELHKNNIGVILDWVPSHFPEDAHGLHRFDGSYLYEHEDRRKGFHPDWKSYIFNYGRNEVRSFLISNALFWLERYHVDGLRVDAVASMLYLDYSRKENEWIPNEFGGRENLEAVHFLKEFNEAVYLHFPDVHSIAEESTSWPGVTKPTFANGLGFGMKWMMGWMNDTLSYFKEDPINRKYHHDKMTFGTVYAFHENFMLPFSHDEVVHGKESMIYKMPGDEWQKFANLRALYLYMFTFSGTKLLFMGSEFGQTSEWNVNQSLDFHLLEFEPHKKTLKFIQSLNKTYKEQSALYQKSFQDDGFEWVELGDHLNSIFVYLRKGNEPKDQLLVILNLTPTVRNEYRVGVPFAGQWDILLNSDSEEFYGSNYPVEISESKELPWMNQPFSVTVSVPPLSGLILKQAK